MKILLKVVLLVTTLALHGNSQNSCPKLPSGLCFVDCTQPIYNIVCEKIRSRPLHKDLTIFSGLNIPFILRLWNTEMARMGGNIFAPVTELMLGLETQNCLQLRMLPEVTDLKNFKNLTIRNSPSLKHLPTELLPSSIESISLEMTGVTQFLHDKTETLNLTSLKHFKVSHQTVEYLTDFLLEFPRIETVEIWRCHMKTNKFSDGVFQFATKYPLKKLRLENNTYTAAIGEPGDDLLLFPLIFASLLVDENTMIKFVDNEFPIAKSTLNSGDLRSAFKAQYISFRGSKFEGFNTLSGLFTNFTNLQTLDLGYTRLPHATGSVLAGLPNLEVLMLDGNEFRDLTTVELFQGIKATNFSVLDLSNNALRFVPYGMQYAGVNLTKLNLRKNVISLEELAVAAKWLPKLKVLDLSANQLTDFNSTILAGMKDLSSLDLSCNRFQTVDKEFFTDLPRSLVSLNMTFCTKTEHERPILSEDAFQTMPPIKKLSLGSGYFRDGVFTRLSAMPNKTVSSLEELDLSQNRIAWLHSRGAKLLVGFDSLEILNLRGNSLQSIGRAAFAAVKNLKELNLADNALFSIGPDDFDGLDNLQYLDISNNGILLIAKTALDSVPNLVGLFLADNHIADILTMFDKGGKQLRHLDIMNLPLACVDPEIFKLYRSLKWLYMNNSQIVFVDMDSSLDVSQQIHQTSPLPRYRTVCDDKETVGSIMDQFETGFLHLNIDDPKSLVYQDLLANYPTCLDLDYRGIKEASSSTLC